MVKGQRAANGGPGSKGSKGSEGSKGGGIALTGDAYKVSVTGLALWVI